MVVRSCFVDPVTFCCWEGGKSVITRECGVMWSQFSRYVLQFLVQPMFYGTFINTRVPAWVNPHSRVWTC